MLATRDKRLEIDPTIWVSLDHKFVKHYLGIISLPFLALELIYEPISVILYTGSTTTPPDLRIVQNGTNNSGHILKNNNFSKIGISIFGTGVVL